MAETGPAAAVAGRCHEQGGPGAETNMSLQHITWLRQSPLLLLLLNCLSVTTEGGSAAAVAGRCNEQGGPGTGAT